MTSRRVILRGGFAAVVFAALLSIGLGYAVRSTDRGGDGTAAGEWWVDLLGAWESFVPDVLDSLLVSLLPGWLGYAELAGILVLVLTLIAWAGAEARWAGWTAESALAQARAFRERHAGGDSSPRQPTDADADLGCPDENEDETD